MLHPKCLTGTAQSVARARPDAVLPCSCDGERGETDLERALTTFLADHRDEPKRIFTSYTAMRTLRRLLSQRYDLPEMGEDAQDSKEAGA